MRQALEEGFILDVLRGYQTYKTEFEIEQRGHDGVITTITSDDERVTDGSSWPHRSGAASYFRSSCRRMDSSVSAISWPNVLTAWMICSPGFPGPGNLS
jgi:hypothetical protein